MSAELDSVKQVQRRQQKLLHRIDNLSRFLRGRIHPPKDTKLSQVWTLQQPLFYHAQQALDLDVLDVQVQGAEKWEARQGSREGSGGLRGASLAADLKALDPLELRRLVVRLQRPFRVDQQRDTRIVLLAPHDVSPPNLLAHADRRRRRYRPPRRRAEEGQHARALFVVRPSPTRPPAPSVAAHRRRLLAIVNEDLDILDAFAVLQRLLRQLEGRQNASLRDVQEAQLDETSKDPERRFLHALEAGGEADHPAAEGQSARYALHGVQEGQIPVLVDVVHASLHLIVREPPRGRGAVLVAASSPASGPGAHVGDSGDLREARSLEAHGLDSEQSRMRGDGSIKEASARPFADLWRRFGSKEGNGPPSTRQPFLKNLI
eukprot:scaffold63_cov306-Pinguiococcus_pyrenoidosus.AAC.60